MNTVLLLTVLKRIIRLGWSIFNTLNFIYLFFLIIALLLDLRVRVAHRSCSRGGVNANSVQPEMKLGIAVQKACFFIVVFFF